jgi:hypothetical protein
LLIYRGMNTKTGLVSGSIAVGLLAASLGATGCETHERVVVRAPPPRVVYVAPQPAVVVAPAPVVQERVIIRP